MIWLIGMLGLRGLYESMFHKILPSKSHTYTSCVFSKILILWLAKHTHTYTYKPRTHIPKLTHTCLWLLITTLEVGLVPSITLSTKFSLSFFSIFFVTNPNPNFFQHSNSSIQSLKVSHSHLLLQFSHFSRF
jgi:hypothetical protein